jgi:predicted ABC-type sugar transport system permease subunit
VGITGAGSLKAWERLESGSGSVFSRKLPGFKQMVGGASLMGGEGRVFGTLIGALIIAVIENGMNLLGVESYTQKVALGCVILGAVALDRLKRSGGH